MKKTGFGTGEQDSVEESEWLVRQYDAALYGAAFLFHGGLEWNVLVFRFQTPLFYRSSCMSSLDIWLRIPVFLSRFDSGSGAPGFYTDYEECRYFQL